MTTQLNSYQVTVTHLTENRVY